MAQKKIKSNIMGSEDLLDMAAAFQKSRIILTAFEMGICSIIAKASLSSQEISHIIGTPHRSTDRLLNALCGLGILKKNKGLFSNTALSARYLVKGSEEYLSRIGHMINLYRSWGTLTEAVRHGGSVAGREYDEASLAYFIEAMHQRARMSAAGLVSHLDLDGVNRMLDVGGGSGVYSMAFAKARPGLRAVVFDLPAVTKLTKKYIAESGLSGRVKTMKGNYHTDDFGKGYDLVFMSAILHINSPDENQAIITKAYESLNPGGRIVIQDFVMDEDRTAPLQGVLFSLNMLVNTQHGDTYTEQEMRAWLQEAGYVNIQKISTGTANDLMVGVRPS